MATRREEDLPRLTSSPLMPEPGHDLASSLHKELHRLAGGKMRFERRNRTLMNFEEIALQLSVSNTHFKARLNNGQRVAVPGTIIVNRI